MAKRDVEFLFEMGNIRLVQRTWRRFYTPEFANLAEHHFRMFWIAMVIAEREGNVDTGRIAKMVLVHDIAESRTGDVDYLSRQYVERNQELGIKDMLKDTALEKEFYELWQEYEAHETKEAQIAKDADMLDIDFELAEQAFRGNGLLEVVGETRKFTAENKFHTKTAKQLFKTLRETNPMDWYSNGRNRFTGGDWKK